MSLLNTSKTQLNATVFIDASVANLADLLPALDAGTEVITLNAKAHGLTQIAKVLRERKDIHAVHILSHGTSGSLHLGSTVIDADALTAHAEDLKVIRAALADNADLLLYGCHVAEGDTGQSFIQLLSEMTNANVAASVDATGAKALGGNWTLTAQTGSIDTKVLSAESWNGLLALTLTPVTGTAAAVGATLANTIAGPGVTVNSASFTGLATQAATFTGGASTWLGFDSGILITTGAPSEVVGSNTNGGNTVGGGSAGDSQLTTLAGNPTYDAGVLTMTITPTSNKITLQFTFGSEEYVEFVNSGYNDVMAVWVNGVQSALLPTGQPVTINSVNLTSNQSLYKNNPNSASGGPFTTGMDGFTVTQSFIATVNPGVSNTIKIGIADALDGQLDSFLFVRASSMETTAVAYNDAVMTAINTPITINAIANDVDLAGLPLNITSILDMPVTPGGAAVTLPTGATVQLNSAGKLVFTPKPGSSAPDIFTYTVTDSAGTTALGYVTTTIGINPAPVATATAPIGNEDAAITVSLAGTDNGSVASINVTTLPLASQGVLYKADGITPVVAGAVAGAALTPAEAATLKFIPAPNFNGTVIIPFTVVDNQGATSPSANATITVKPVPEAQTGSLTHDAINDTGSSNTDSITQNPSPAISGSGATPGETITLYAVNGTTVLGTALVDGAGNWSIDPATDYLAEGLNNLSIKATDPISGLQGVATTIPVTLDTTAPSAPTVSALTTNDTTPIITGTSGTGTALVVGEVLSVVVNGATYTVVPNA
ncbi:MAG: DUF4347 domain-containing protein, partial [Methylococcaceae bacterium]|nr:DUF4347 domain-containing protein [Methylococcaceae bacterium]